MKFTHLSLTATFATVAFAEKYAFFAKPEGGDMMILGSGMFHGQGVLSYDNKTKEEPVLFDKVGNVYKTSEGGFKLGSNGNFFAYAKNSNGFKFIVDQNQDGLITNAEGYVCHTPTDPSRFLAFQLQPGGVDECIRSTFYIKVVSDDEIFSIPSAAPSSVEASSIFSEVPQPVSSDDHESSSAVHESSSVHVQKPSSSIAAATEHSNIASESHVSSNEVSSSSVAVVSAHDSSVHHSIEASAASSVTAASSVASSSPESGDVCACMEASLQCVANPDADPSQFGGIFDWACGRIGDGGCDPIDQSKKGIYAACSDAQKVGYVMNAYYLSQNKTVGTCDFQGVATLQESNDQCKASGSGSASPSAGSSVSAGVSSGSASASSASNSVAASSASNSVSASSASNSVAASSASNSASASSASASSGPFEGDVCACMEAGLACVAKPDADASQFGGIFDWACGQGGVNCTAINQGSIYGACSDAQKVGYVMNAYHLLQNKTVGTCDFQGVATLQTPAPGQCSASVSGSASGSAGSSGSGSSSAPAGSSSGSGSAASVANALVSGSAAGSVAAGSASAASVAAGSDSAVSIAPFQWNASTVTRESTETSTVCTKCQAGESSLVTVWKTYTDYTTYCPSETTLTITKCDKECYPSTVTVTSATTLTVTGVCIVPETSVASEHPVETGSSAHPVESAPAHPVGSAPEHPAETSVAAKPVESGNSSNPSKPVESGNGSNPSKPVQSSSAPNPINGKGNGNNNKPASGAPNPTMVTVASNPKSSSSSESETTQTFTSSVTLRPVSLFDNGASKNGAFGALVIGFAALLL